MTLSPAGEPSTPATELGNHARRLESEDVTRAGRRWVEALALEKIGAVDPRAGDTNHDLTVASDRVRDIPDVQLLGSARRSDDDGAQR